MSEGCAAAEGRSLLLRCESRSLRPKPTHQVDLEICVFRFSLLPISKMTHLLLPKDSPHHQQKSSVNKNLQVESIVTDKKRQTCQKLHPRRSRTSHSNCSAHRRSSRWGCEGSRHGRGKIHPVAGMTLGGGLPTQAETSQIFRERK